MYITLLITSIIVNIYYKNKSTKIPPVSLLLSQMRERNLIYKKIKNRKKRLLLS